MPKEKPLRVLLGQLNQEYRLSEEFKTRVGQLIDRLEGLDLAPEQIELVLGKVRDTYERQMVVELCRQETRKSLDGIQGAIEAYSNVLNNINHRLSQAEAALETLLNSGPATSRVRQEQAALPIDKEKAKALVAFVQMNTKNSRIN
jgi:hypothetical protein